MHTVHTMLRQTLCSFPEVVSSWLTSDVTTAFHGPFTGWLACPITSQPALITQLKRSFSPGVYDRSFFFGRVGDAVLSLLVFDPNRPDALPPGFSAIEFLDDRGEAALVQYCSAAIDACDFGVAQASHLLETRSNQAARHQVALTAERLKNVLACMFWRDVNVPREILPSGPWRALQVELDRMPEQLPKRVAHLSVLVQGVRQLLTVHHAPTKHRPSANSGALVPLWYGDLQAVSYDRHRYFPDCIGPYIAALLNAMPVRRVTEIGVGTGRFSLAILEAGAQADFMLLDNSRAMLDNLYRKLPTYLRGKVIVGEGTLDGLADTPGVVDVLLEHEVFFLHPNPTRMARNIVKGLSPEGVVIRLERSTLVQPTALDATIAFDRQIAAGLGSPIGFVGEDSAHAVDQALGLQGFETRRHTLTRYSRTITNKELRDARRSRTFPYLAHVPEPILDAAINCFSESPYTGDLQLEERYDMAISFRSGTIEIDRLMAILETDKTVD